MEKFKSVPASELEIFEVQQVAANMKKQRESFESAVMRSLYGQMGTPEELFRRDADGDCYTNPVIQSAWWGYRVGGASICRLEEGGGQ